MDAIMLGLNSGEKSHSEVKRLLLSLAKLELEMISASPKRAEVLEELSELEESRERSNARLNKELKSDNKDSETEQRITELKERIKSQNMRKKIIEKKLLFMMLESLQVSESYRRYRQKTLHIISKEVVVSSLQKSVTAFMNIFKSFKDFYNRSYYVSCCHIDALRLYELLSSNIKQKLSACEVGKDLLITISEESIEIRTFDDNVLADMARRKESGVNLSDIKTESVSILSIQYAHELEQALRSKEVSYTSGSFGAEAASFLLSAGIFAANPGGGGGSEPEKKPEPSGSSLKP